MKSNDLKELILARTNYSCNDTRIIIYHQTIKFVPSITSELNLFLEGEKIEYIWLEPNVDNLIRKQFQTHQEGLTYIDYAKNNLTEIHRLCN